jgi:hypothetical protein
MIRTATLAICIAGCAGWEARPLLPPNPPLAARDLALEQPAREPPGKLSPMQIHRDLQVLMLALTAYDVPDLLVRQILPLDLMPLARKALTPEELCLKIAEIVRWRSRQPKIFVTRADGATCGRPSPMETDTFGRRGPTGDGPFAIETRATDAGPVAVLAVNRFEARDRELWQELPRALAAVSSGGLVVGLRGVPGTDPTGGMLLARLLSGHAEVSPVRGVRIVDSALAGVLRANHRRRSGLDDTSAPPWVSFADIPADPIRTPRDRRVIIDHGCREACVLTAIALRLKAGVEILGTPSFGWARGAHPGLVVLPTSGIQVSLPTTVVDLEDTLGIAITGYTLGTNLLDAALGELRMVLAARSRVKRWRERDPPPLCTNPEKLTEAEVLATAGKFDRFFDIRELPADRLVGVLAKLSIGADRARRLLAACPGVTVSLALETREGETIVSVTAPRDVLFRIAANDVVVEIERGAYHLMGSQAE